MPAVASRTTLMLATAHLARHDQRLATVIGDVGSATITPHRAYYQALVESIISQQLSVKAAATILQRFLGLFPADSFPLPTAILALGDEQLRSVGLSRQKASYIKDLAHKVISGTVVFDNLDVLSNDAIIAELTTIKGVGVWTVHMFLLFCMGRLDVLPTGDLGIKNGIQKLYQLDVAPTPSQIEQLAQDNQWHPYESVASWYIWKSLDNKA